RLTKPCCIFLMGCWGVIRHIFVPVRIANAMNGKKAFAPRSAKIRITGLENYTRCGVALKLDLVANPGQLELERHAARSAAWLFVTKGCLKYSGDLVRVTQIINGGRNGIGDRRERFEKKNRCWYESVICSSEKILVAAGVYFADGWCVYRR
ncbi:hypothetical protein SEEN4900_20134, partial [Salmonella enterica subsp. enterica serovar Newport str. WA_14900]